MRGSARVRGARVERGVRKDVVAQLGGAPRNVQPHFDPTRLYSIQFTINPGVVFDLWVDNLTFYKP